MSDHENKPDDLTAVRTLIETLKSFPREDQLRILRWTQEKLGLLVSIDSSPAVTNPDIKQNEPPSTDIKSFYKQKQPSSDNQFAAVVAYYYGFEAPENKRKQEIESKDLQEAARLAGRSRIADPNTTLNNALKMGYLDRGQGRGTFKINTVGENLVAMTLPSIENNVTTAKRSKPVKRSRKTDNKTTSKKKSNR